MPHDAEPITFEQRGDGVYVRACWPKFVLISTDLLATPLSGVMQVEGDTVTFTVRNGRAEYTQDMGGTREAERFRLGANAYVPMEHQHAA